jgi:hypothetical protein
MTARRFLDGLAQYTNKLFKFKTSFNINNDNNKASIDNGS